MAKLISFENGQITSFDLDANSFWRLKAATTAMSHDTFALSLVFVFPPGIISGPDPAQPFVPAQATLVRVPIGISDDHSSVDKVASVMLSMGSETEDKERTAEAFMLWKNNRRPPSESKLEEAIEAAQGLVSVYWQLRSWIFSGCKERLEIPIAGSVVQGIP